MVQQKKNSNKSIVTGRQMKLGRKDAPLNWCSRSQFGLIRQTCSCTKSGDRKWCWWATSEESLGVFSCAGITTQTQKIKKKKSEATGAGLSCSKLRLQIWPTHYNHHEEQNGWTAEGYNIICLFQKLLLTFKFVKRILFNYSHIRSAFNEKNGR